MKKISKAIVDASIRTELFNLLDMESREGFNRINDRQWGCLVTDLNGDTRYVRIGAIVAELREDMTAEELMQSEIDAYNLKQEEKALKAEQAKKKAEADKARRSKEKEKEESGD